MRITDVRVMKGSKRWKNEGSRLLTLDDEFVVHDIKVIEGEKGFIYRHAEPESIGWRITVILLTD